MMTTKKNPLFVILVYKTSTTKDLHSKEISYLVKSDTFASLGLSIVMGNAGCPIKKVSIKKLLFGAAQGFSSQFLNLFGFSIFASFVWCII